MNYRKIGVITGIILIILFGLYMYFKNDIKAYQEGIDVKYLDNPKYCVQNSDCAQTTTCDIMNIYNYNRIEDTCMQVKCGSVCDNNVCRFKNATECGVKVR